MNRYVRWGRAQSQIVALFTHRLPSLSGPDRGHFRTGHRTISLSDMPRIDHHSQGWGLGFAPLFSCQPTFGSDGKTKARSDSKVFHPSDSGKQQDKETLRRDQISLFFRISNRTIIAWQISSKGVVVVVDPQSWAITHLINEVAWLITLGSQIAGTLVLWDLRRCVLHTVYRRYT